MADLFGDADSLDRDVSELTALGRPVCVLVRPAPVDRAASPAERFEARPDLFTREYARDGFSVYAVKSGEPASGP